MIADSSLILRPLRRLLVGAPRGGYSPPRYNIPRVPPSSRAPMLLVCFRLKGVRLFEGDRHRKEITSGVHFGPIKDPLTSGWKIEHFSYPGPQESLASTQQFTWTLVSPWSGHLYSGANAPLRRCFGVAMRGGFLPGLPLCWLELFALNTALQIHADQIVEKTALFLGYIG